MRHRALSAIALLSWLLFVPLASAQAPAQSEALREANALFRQGELGRALDRVDAHLKDQPRDARGRFLKGLILAEQRKPDEAIRVFNELTQEYPELPEPYNNLAVLYASQGNYDKARTALEMAIRTHPSYATAHENLGDIYAKMASQAYDKALRLDKGNTTAQTKLNLIKDLFTAGPSAPKSSSSGIRPIQIATAAPKPKAPVEIKRPEPKPAPPAEKPAPAVKAPAAKARNPEEVVDTVNDWANAWSSNDIPAYLAHYARDFKTPKGESRKSWEAVRRTRIAKPRRIQVKVESPKVVFHDNGRVSVTFLQHYHSGNYNVSSTKTLVMVRAGDKWLIQQERIGG